MTTDESAAIEKFTDRPIAKFVDLRRDAVASLVRYDYAEFAANLLRDHVPILVDRRAGDPLRRMDAASVLVT